MVEECIINNEALYALYNNHIIANIISELSTDL